MRIVLVIILIISLLVVFNSNVAAQGKWKKFHDDTIGPGPREGHGMVVDEARQKIILFGGYEGSEGFMNDTWEFDLNRLKWTKKYPKHSPRERAYFAAAYDPVRKKVVIQGGYQKFDSKGSRWISPSTWEWDGQDWKLASINSPGAISYHEMVWDAAREEMISFGGYSMDGPTYYPDDVILGSTNGYKNGHWYQKDPFDSPIHRIWYILVYDSKNKRVLMHGGVTDSARYLGQEYTYCFSQHLFCWEGENWHLLAGGGPGPRARHAAAFDTDRGTMVMYGGYYYSGWPEFLPYDDTWEFNNDTWRKVEIKSGNPGPRMHHAMVYDTINKRVWMFGGHTGFRYNGQLWYYTVNPENDLQPIKILVRARNGLKRGNVANFSARIKNSGDDPSDMYSLKFFFSNDKMLSDDDTLILSKELKKEIRPGKSIKYSFIKKISKKVPAGEYYLIAKIDSKDIDLNRNNNIVVKTRRVYVGDR